MKLDLPGKILTITGAGGELGADLAPTSTMTSRR
jgi:hypothetical protein